MYKYIQSFHIFSRRAPIFQKNSSKYKKWYSFQNLVQLPHHRLCNKVLDINALPFEGVSCVADVVGVTVTLGVNRTLDVIALPIPLRACLPLCRRAVKVPLVLEGDFMCVAVNKDDQLDFCSFKSTYFRFQIS